MWSPSSCYRRFIFSRQTYAFHLHSLTGNSGLQLPFLPFRSFSIPLWCFFSSYRPSVPDVFSNAEVGYEIQERMVTNKKNRNILNLLLQANVSTMFHIWTFPHSNSSRLTCRCSPSHLLVVAVEKCLTTNGTCSVSEKWVLDSTVATSGRRITPCRRHPTFLSQ